MSIGKREKLLLIILGLLIYLMIAVKFVWMPIIPQIFEKNDALAKAIEQKNTLDNDVKNISKKKAELTAIKASDEKLGYYLMEQANITDSIEYIEKLSVMLGKDLNGINICAPVERTTTEELTTSKDKNSNKSKDNKSDSANGIKFYEFGISFSTKLDYANSVELLRYLEGGSKKVRVSYFKMAPFTDTTKTQVKPLANVQKTDPQNSQPLTPQDIKKLLEKLIAPEKKLFQIDMTINLYSMKTGNVDKLYEYSRHRFSTYSKGNALPYVASTKAAGTGADAAGGGNADITISENSFLTAGDNLLIAGINNDSEKISVKTKKIHDIRLNITSSGYSIETADSNGRPVRISGMIPSRDLNMNISADIPAVDDNAGLGMNITIINDSGKNLNINLSDDSKRVKLFDRNGASIYTESTGEKILVK